MPTITIRLKPTAKADLELAARRSNQSVSDYVRETLALREADASARIDALEEQVQALTRAANHGYGHIPEFEVGSR
jgi:hypothetical protein